MDLILKDLKLQCKFFKILVLSNDKGQTRNDPYHLGNISWSLRIHTMVNEDTYHGQLNYDPDQLFQEIVFTQIGYSYKKWNLFFDESFN